MMDYVGDNPLFLISGPSGCGKTVVTEMVLKNKLTTTTTRGRRLGETDGKDYYFISSDEFHKKIDNDEFVEWAPYVNHFYGTTKEEFEQKLVNDHAYVICEYQGLSNFKKAYSRVVSIFIYCTKEESIERMKKRNDPEQKLRERIGNYDTYVSHREKYDYVIHNKEISQTIKEIERIVRLETEKAIGR